MNKSNEEKTHNFFEFSNYHENIGISNIRVFSLKDESIFKFSPNSNNLAFYHNLRIEIYSKNNNWERIVSYNFNRNCGEIKDLNWSLDSKMLLIYFNRNGEESYEKVINLDDSTSWNCEIKITGRISYSCFYPDSKSIILLKDRINILKIYDLTKKNLQKKYSVYEYSFLKFVDQRAINFIKYNEKNYLLVPILKFNENNKNKKNQKKYVDYILVIEEKNNCKYINVQTQDLDKIITINNGLNYFMITEKEYDSKRPFFYLYNILGELLNIIKLNDEFEIKNYINPIVSPSGEFFIVQNLDKKRQEIIACKTIICETGINFDILELTKNKQNITYLEEKILVSLQKDSFELNDLSSNSESNFPFNFNSLFTLINGEKKNINSEKNYCNKNPKIINYNNNNKNTNKNNINERKLMKVNKINYYEKSKEICKIEISLKKKCIAFMTKDNSNILFFANFFKSNDIFKVIKFSSNILCFKWNSSYEILLVTLDSPFFYLIDKDYYVSYDLLENYFIDQITWSSSGKEVILTSQKRKINLIISF